MIQELRNADATARLLLERKRLQSKHLAQGAPTSAQLANLCCWRLDCRLQGVAKRFGFQYTRYADDIALSGPYRLARMADFIEAVVGSIAIEEGYRLNHRKTRLRLRSQQPPGPQWQPRPLIRWRTRC